MVCYKDGKLGQEGKLSDAIRKQDGAYIAYG